MTHTDSRPGVRPTGTADLAWLSWLRVVAIAGVVTIHTTGLNATPPGARDTLRGTLAIYLDLGAIFAVPIFVMMSGAMLLDPTKYADAGSFLRKRAARLVPPLVFWHLWYLAIRQHRRAEGLGLEEVLRLVLTGKLYTALYFFWIVLGLALVTPLLLPFVRESTRRQLLVAGGLLAAIPALSLATVGLRGGGVSVDTPWTWWMPYLGLYLLGFGLRGVVLRGLPLLGLFAATVVLGLEQGWQWRNPAAPDLLVQLSPSSYYGALTIVYTLCLFVLFQSLVRRDGLLSPLARGRTARVGRSLGDATLGVFGLHLTVFLLAQDHLFDGRLALDGTSLMLGRTALVLGVTYAVVLVLRKVPFVRAVV